MAKRERIDPVKIYTDGSTSENPGPGGYGIVIKRAGQADLEFSGRMAHATNNEMEMIAAIVGIEKAIELGFERIVIYSDSQYLVKGMTDWIVGWQKPGWRNWRNTSGQPVKNRPLWEELLQKSQELQVSWEWVRSHSGDPDNQRANDLAQEESVRAESLIDSII